MKKLLITLFIFFISTWITFWYTPSTDDTNLLSSMYKKLDIIILKSPKSVESLSTQIWKIKEKYKSNDRVYYLLTELENYSSKILEDNKTYLVKKVIDWDTIDLDYNWKTISVRFIWIDSPESYITRFWYVECYWNEAKTYLKSLIEWKYINIEFDSTQWQTDKYWRYLAYIFLDWVNINNEMIKNWYAWEYTYNKPYKYIDTFKMSGNVASENKVWLWSPSTCNGERTEAVKITTNSWSIKSDTSVNVETIQNQIQTSNTSNFSCLNKKNYCTEMKTCEEAKFYLNNCWLERLDADKDWVPCESLCK